MQLDIKTKCAHAHACSHTHTYIKIDLDIDIITYIVANIQHSLFIVIGIFYSIGLWVMSVDHTENNRQIKSKH